MDVKLPYQRVKEIMNNPQTLIEEQETGSIKIIGEVGEPVILEPYEINCWDDKSILQVIKSRQTPLKTHVKESKILKPEANDDFIYIMSPYACNNDSLTDDEKSKVMFGRFTMITQFAGYCISLGISVYSPITMSHPINNFSEFKSGWETWGRQDFTFISKAKECWAVLYEGWKDSKGMTAEISFCNELNIPIRRIPVQTTTNKEKNKEGTDVKHIYDTVEIQPYLKEFGKLKETE